MWEWFIAPIYGDLGDGLLLFYPHYIQFSFTARQANFGLRTRGVTKAGDLHSGRAPRWDLRKWWFAVSGLEVTGIYIANGCKW
jgi:hypothetical protein